MQEGRTLAKGKGASSCFPFFRTSPPNRGFEPSRKSSGTSQRDSLRAAGATGNPPLCPSTATVLTGPLTGTFFETTDLEKQAVKQSFPSPLRGPSTEAPRSHSERPLPGVLLRGWKPDRFPALAGSNHRPSFPASTRKKDVTDFSPESPAGIRTDSGQPNSGGFPQGEVRSTTPRKSSCAASGDTTRALASSTDTLDPHAQ